MREPIQTQVSRAHWPTHGRLPFDLQRPRATRERGRVESLVCLTTRSGYATHVAPRRCVSSHIGEIASGQPEGAR
jgi:hypothetical protein